MTAGDDEKKAPKPSFEGTVEEALPNLQFLVRLRDGRAIRAMVAKSARPLMVKVLPGDRVVVETFPFDPSRGSILRKMS